MNHVDESADDLPLRYVVVGEDRCGSSAVATALAATGVAVCHVDPLHADESVRACCHGAYFDECVDPLWCSSAYRYLLHGVFARGGARRGEHAVGLRLSYRQLVAHDLFDLFEELARGPVPFRVVHVVRNPAACYVSYKQARASGLWGVPREDPPNRYYPPAVRVDPLQVTRYVRNSIALRRKLDAGLGRAVLRVPYRRLWADHAGAMAAVHEHLGLAATPAKSAYRRLRNRPLAGRVSNCAELFRCLPPDVREVVFEDETADCGVPV